jgi:thioesterase domain-containing protein
MRISFPITPAYIMALACLAWTAGCNQQSQDQPTLGGSALSADASHDDYSPHDVPITDEQKAEMRRQSAQFADAVAMIKQLRNETEAETKNGIPENPYKAHQALDRADLLLQWLPEIARNSGVPKAHWEEVNTTANDLRTLFEQVHQHIDNKKEPDFASVAAQMDEKIAALEVIAQAGPKAPATNG